MVISDPQSRASRTDRTRLKEFKEGTASDDKLQIIISTVLEGWPSILDKVPAEFKPYFQFEDEITAQNSLLFKGERLIAPAKLRKEIMEKVHSSSYLGTEGCLRRAREVFYWLRMKAEFKDFIIKYNICSSHKLARPQEPLIPHRILSRPWQKIDAYLFLPDQRH